MAKLSTLNLRLEACRRRGARAGSRRGRRVAALRARGPTERGGGRELALEILRLGRVEPRCCRDREHRRPRPRETDPHGEARGTPASGAPGQPRTPSGLERRPRRTTAAGEPDPGSAAPRRVSALGCTRPRSARRARRVPPCVTTATGRSGTTIAERVGRPVDSAEMTVGSDSTRRSTSRRVEGDEARALEAGRARSDLAAARRSPRDLDPLDREKRRLVRAAT